MSSCRVPQFAEVVEEGQLPGNCNLKGIYLFWNMVDKRERTKATSPWNRVIQKAELRLLESWMPDTKRYNRGRLPEEQYLPFHTVPSRQPPDKGSGLCELIDELCAVTHLDTTHTL